MNAQTEEEEIVAVLAARRRMIEDAVNMLRNQNVEPTFEAIKEALPIDFDFCQQFDPWVEVTALSVATTLDSERDADALRAQLAEVTDRLSQARADLMGLQVKLRLARANVGDAVRRVNVGPKITPLQLVRDHLARSQAEQAARVAGLGPSAPVATPGDSVIDRSAVFSAGGDGSDFARKQVRNGHRRGAFPASMRGTMIPKTS